ncbi:dihydroorotate dehydrogenase electron transfer subunit [Streptomyces sp. NBC_01264]|uniref:dihydroorotate dehydrogenase electron transfer subunit n=1 Tax=Streptomyces sp. NBC_01264 TaxID=2903804 RepID=UPI0022527C49|nr:dihydroorotate dehydrogenase electron transfer subunit [Streptomyces sp. NBC_01264]MCX4777151.1 dihydroorotate dehydrogenase electron transfer subunit [Streptomyces sp. NBC_01264]
MPPVQTAATIRRITPVGAYHHLVLDAPGVTGVRPGHFGALAIGGRDSAMLLRRAFSIHRADPDQGTVEFVFAEAGRGTRALAAHRPGDTVDLIAPLGTPFPLPDGPVGAVLVAGGYGSAPMFALAEEILGRGGRVAFVLGAATADRLFGVERAEALAEHVYVVTDDGSAGRRGRVTDALFEAITVTGATEVHSCGPMGMLKAVTEIATAAGAASHTAVEEAMACGIGICMSCVLPVTGPDGVTRFLRSCTSGPVFDGATVRWDDAGTLPEDLEGAAAMTPKASEAR